MGRIVRLVGLGGVRVAGYWAAADPELGSRTVLDATEREPPKQSGRFNCPPAATPLVERMRRMSTPGGTTIISDVPTARSGT